MPAEPLTRLADVLAVVRERAPDGRPALVGIDGRSAACSAACGAQD